MGDLDRPLRQVFRFEVADLAANRAGRLSPRQSALLRAGRMGMQLSLAVFVVVMLGTVGLVAFPRDGRDAVIPSRRGRAGARVGGPRLHGGE